MLINNKNISDELISKLISDIKKKKELSPVKDSLVQEELLKFLKQNTKILERFLKEKAEKSKEYELAVKTIRSTLRKLHGAFVMGVDYKKASEMISQGKIDEVMQMHESTKPRICVYQSLYKRIFSITGKPEVIVDLGSGLNPLSYNHLGCKPKYYAYELSANDVQLINLFFKKSGIDGKAEQKDLQNDLDLPKSDVCFMFKILDGFKMTSGPKFVEKLITTVDAKFIVASFSTATISGKRMRYPRRLWLEKMCERLNYSIERFEMADELYYVIGK